MIATVHWGSQLALVARFRFGPLVSSERANTQTILCAVSARSRNLVATHEVLVLLRKEVRRGAEARR